MARARGRLSKIQLLPRECSHIVQWASEELQAMNRTLSEIYEEFVDKLEALDRETGGELKLDIPSFSSFHRHSVHIDAAAREIIEMREMASAVMASVDIEDADETTKFITESIKAAVAATVRTHKGKLNPKSLLELAKTLREVALAQATSAAHRQKMEEEFRKKTTEAVNDAGKKAGISQETLDEINRKLGAA